MNKLKKRKLFKYGLLSSFSLLAIIPTSHLLKSKTEFNESTLNSSDFKQQNDELIMSKNIGFPVYTIQKTGHDAKRVNFLIVGNGYKKSEVQNFTKYVNKITQTFLNFEPYKQFSHLINIYAILATEEDDSKYFNIRSGGIYGINDPDRTKLKNIVDKLEHSFLDQGGQIDDISIATVDFGRAVAAPWANFEFGQKWINIIHGGDGDNDGVNDGDIDGVYLHETGHSFARLGDEYPGGGGDEDSPNLASSEWHARTKWGEFFGFKGIAARWMGRAYRPSNRCLMIISGTIPCEVCKHHIFLKLKELTELRGNEHVDMYVANPSITLKHDDFSSYQELAEENVYGSRPITDAQNNQIDFSTIVHNFKNTPIKIKLKMWIEDSSKAIKKEWTQEFDVKPNELKKLTLFTEEITENVYKINEEDKIFGEVIDSSTNKVIDSRRTHSERIFGYGYKKVTLNYKLYENGAITNKDVPTSYLGNKYFNLKEGAKFTLTPPTLKGFRYKQAVGELSFEANNDKEITLYYEKLPSKTFNTQLKDEYGKVVQTKQQTIYENEVFVPGFYDFFITDSTTKLLDKKKSIPQSNKIWKYNEIKENELLLTYNIVPDATPMFNHYRVVLDYGSTWNHVPYSWAFSYLWERNHFSINTKNDVDTKKPGVYYVSFETNFSDWQHEEVTVSFKRNNTIKVIVKNEDGSLPSEDIDEQLRTEKARIDSSYFYLMKWRYKIEEINSINGQNLFQEFVYGLREQSDFTYEVINLNKSENNKIKFNLRIIKDGKSIDSNQIYLYYKNTDSTEPEPDQDFQQIEQEKTRINNLILSLKKQEYSFEEISAINSSNLFNELNGWSTNSGFSYEVVEFTNNNTNKIDFKIKITKNQKTDTSKLFSLSYKLTSQPIDPVQEELKTEKNKIDNSNLVLVKEEYSQSEIDNLTSDTLIKELKNLNLDNTKFSYSIINFKKDISNKNISFQIQISKDGKSVTTNEFNLSYKLSSTDNDNNNENNNDNKGNNNNLPIILTATLVPVSLVILGVIGYTFIRIKKNRH